MIFWQKSCSMHYYDSTEVIRIHKGKTEEYMIHYGLYYIWTDLQVCTDWFETTLKISKNLNAIGCSETKLIHEIFNQSFMRKSHFLNLGESPERYQVSNWKQRRTIHTTRPRSGRVVYKKLLLRYLADFFRNRFSKSVSFGARVCPPLGAGEKFFGKPGD